MCCRQAQGARHDTEQARQASDSHLDLGCAPYVLYGVQYIDLVPLALLLAALGDSHLDLSRAPYELYGVKYIDPASLALLSASSARQPTTTHHRYVRHGAPLGVIVWLVYMPNVRCWLGACPATDYDSPRARAT